MRTSLIIELVFLDELDENVFYKPIYNWKGHQQITIGRVFTLIER
jgi:hypothetical protein